MMSERDIEAQLGETDERIRAVVAEIGPLQQRVSQGTPGWQDALTALADCYNRRRELQVRRDSLSWVLS